MKMIIKCAFRCHTAASQQQMALNFELVGTDENNWEKLVAYKQFKISAPGVGMQRKWQLDGLSFWSLAQSQTLNSELSHRLYSTLN